MRKSIVSIAVFVILALLVAERFRPRVAPRVQSNPLPVSPISMPAADAVQGPYFSNGGRVGDRIVAAINQTQKTLDVAMYDLTEPSIAGAIEAARRRGVEIRIVADAHQSQEPHSEIPYLASRGIAVRLSRGYRGDRSIMHDKFAVFDHRLVETGSFNWTTSADEYNFENAIFIANSEIASRYENEFETIWRQAR